MSHALTCVFFGFVIIIIQIHAVFFDTAEPLLLDMLAHSIWLPSSLHLANQGVDGNNINSISYLFPLHSTHNSSLYLATLDVLSC